MKIRRILPALALSSIVLLSGCSDPSTPSIGEQVSVQFRRDVLGAANAVPIGPTTDTFNGASVSVKGELLSLNKYWVVVQAGEVTYWISRPTVLMLSQR